MIIYLEHLIQSSANAQYTPPTPTRRNCFVASRRRRRCVHEFATTDDGFGDANAQRSRMGHDCRRVCSHRRHDETVAKLRIRVHTADATRLDSFVSSASAVCIGLKGLLGSFMTHHFQLVLFTLLLLFIAFSRSLYRPIALCGLDR